ncbi:arsenate resistance ArsH [Lipomyces tetrasporus]|uniref:Arsenate resistance ArsH n=1 Tax=Lipomyces tetrasporus TaxID=54092 RepID=A0AAD7QYX3_9ASCO|nr:arsenate resistance ArsH [Lipomyces tetrasporus]KAJ8102362.1 arsenate resistance ArsH [Lipomyces tetrasporus]
MCNVVRVTQRALSHRLLSQSRSISSHSRSSTMASGLAGDIISSGGDLNSTNAARLVGEIEPDLAYLGRTLAIPAVEDDSEVRSAYRPFLLGCETANNDWIAQLELSTAMKMAEDEMKRTDRLKILVLYGSMRSRSYSRLLAFEAARILFRLGCDVRIFNPAGLPVKDDVQHDHPKVQELRSLSKWSDGHVWVSPEQHGNLTAVFKNQIDWIPLSTGSVRPTQGRTLAIAQVSGGSQSFNTVNSLRVLGRWMRMFTIPNQSSIPKAYTQFTDADAAKGGSRLMPSGNRDRLVDCMEELVKYTIIMRPHFELFGDRFSERTERIGKREREEQRLREQKMLFASEDNARAVNSSDVVNGVDINGI